VYYCPCQRDNLELHQKRQICKRDNTSNILLDLAAVLVMKLNTPSIEIVAGEEKPARKYTEYNLFFQLEREYILQKLFGVKSALDPDNMFSQEDPKYLGPPLPKRYNDLVLPKEWHIPGKNCKKNRKHTKTHGKISFVDLSRQIAQAWSCADDDVKDYCATMYAIGVVRYKKAMKKYQACSIMDEKSSHAGKGPLSREKEKHGHVTCDHEEAYLLENNDDRLFATIHDDQVANNDSFDTDFDSSIEILFDHFSASSMYDGSHHQVRMNDDEIRSLWRSQEIHDVFLCNNRSNVVCSNIPYCMEIDAQPSLSRFVCTETAPQAPKFRLEQDSESTQLKTADRVPLIHPQSSKFDEERTSTASIVLCREVKSGISRKHDFVNIISPIPDRDSLDSCYGHRFLLER